MSKVAEAKARFEAATNALAIANDEARNARQALDAALAAEAAATPHEWAGRRVKLQEERRPAYTAWSRTEGRRAAKMVTVRGVVTLCDHSKGVLYRGHMPQPGEWFVLSASGITAYRMTDYNGKPVGWELDN